jgi:hypothetical protein
MLETHVMAECERLCPRAPRVNYRCAPGNCLSSHDSPAGLVFLGQLVFDRHKNPFQIYECGLCGKRLIVEMDCHSIDIDDPRWVRSAVPTNSFLNRMKVPVDARHEGRVIYMPDGTPKVIE